MILRTKRAGKHSILSFAITYRLLRFLFPNGAFLFLGGISCRQEVLSVNTSELTAST